MQGNQQKGLEGRELLKAPSGIRGLDEITDGGLPQGRPILICGGPGCGKTLFGLEFLVRGALDYGEPGVLMSFEESSADLAKNVTSLGFDLGDLVERKLLKIDHVRIERSEIEETGEYDLEGIFVRLGYGIDSIKAKRVVLDTIEALFAGLDNAAILRAELRRLFGWLKEKGVTTIITGERGAATLTREGLEEYVSDCVILLDHRVQSHVSTRRLRIVKYRGSMHGTNEYPFLVDEDGITVLPLTSAAVHAQKASEERISSGTESLDEMLGGKGFYRGTTVLVTGAAGSGKTSLAAKFAEATCRRGESCLYFAFEESESQILRNTRSLGMDLGAYVGKNLHFICGRPTLTGLESHLAVMIKRIQKVQSQAVVIDPISSLFTGNVPFEVQAMLIRLIDYLKANLITTFCTSLTEGAGNSEATEMGVSSIADTWIIVGSDEFERERKRSLYILKSRGMVHSHQVREMVLSDRGIELRTQHGVTKGANG